MIESFAKSLSLNVWDWWAVTIAICSLVIASLSFIVARRTLSSQRKTEKNTLPLFTKEKQYEVLFSMTESLIENLIQAAVIKLKWNNTELNKIPSEILFFSNPIDSRELHLELFYDDPNKNLEEKDYLKMMVFPSSYEEVSTLRSGIDTYNKILLTIAHQVQDQILDIETIKQEYDYYVISQNLQLLKQVAEVLDKTFKKEENIRTHIIQYIYIRMALYVPDVRGLLIDQDIDFERIMKEMFEGIEGINDLFEDVKELWTDLFKDYYIPYALPKQKDVRLDTILGFLKICTVGALNHSYKKNPYIKYTKIN